MHLLSNVVSRIAGVRDRITNQIEGNGDQRNDRRGEDQNVGIIQEEGTGVSQQNAQRRHRDVHQAQIGQRSLVRDGAGDRQRQTQDDNAYQIGQDVLGQDAPYAGAEAAGSEVVLAVTIHKYQVADVSRRGQPAYADHREAHDEDVLIEALKAVLEAVKEANARSEQVMEDFQALKEEYAKLVAERIVEEAEEETTEEAEAVEEACEEKGAEEDEAEAKKEVEKEKDAEAQKAEEEADEDKAEGKEEKAEKHEEEAEKDKEEAKEDKEKEEKDYEKAHESVEESLDETAEKIAEEVTEIVEEAVEVEAPKKGRKAYSAFATISESVEEVKEEAPRKRKAFTVFPNL